jgi:hypothetical protein
MWKRLPERKNRGIENSSEAVPEILGCYGELILNCYRELIEKYPMAYLDESWLPANKPEMKQILKIGWLLAKDHQQRKSIEAGWAFLSRFQKGVGNVPADANVPVPVTRDSRAQSDRYLMLAKYSEAEMHVDLQEMRQFIQSQREVAHKGGPPFSLP